MKNIYEVILVEGTNKQEFVDSFDPDTQADWWNMLEYLPNIISMQIEESFVDNLKNDSRVVRVEERLEAFPASPLPDPITMTKTITAVTPATSNPGSNYAPLQFYLDTNQINSGNNGQDKVGVNGTYDNATSISNATYKSRWTGKNVDIVSLEVGPVSATYAGVHNTHPDFANLDTPGSSRLIPMNWTDLEDSSNNQVTSNSALSSHGMGVLSAAGGAICGFAKKSSLRAAYLTAEDGTVECINAIIAWHNNKAINPETGVKNPTIMIGEYQYLVDRRTAIPIENITQISIGGGLILTKPAEGWYPNNFAAFVNNNIIPFQVLDPNTSQYVWCVVLPFQGRFTALQDAITTAIANGIVCINAAGNNGGVYKKINASDYGSIILTASPTTYYTIIYGLDNTSASYATNTTWDPFIPYGPHGVDSAIDVAAGYNSEGIPTLDTYSNRGPGIDIIGLGANTWTAYPSQTFADGHQWGMFSGTSCATPTVVGKAACLMERYFYYNGVWPTPAQTKTLLQKSAVEKNISVRSANWNGTVVSASTIISNSVGSFLCRIPNGNFSNGGITLTDSCGTTRLRAFFDKSEFNTSNSNGKRKSSGAVYPRTKTRFTLSTNIPQLPHTT